MRKMVYILSFISVVMLFSCVKQKMRFHEPELTKENYNIPNAITFFTLYYKKHLKSALETSDSIAIAKDQRGDNSEKVYSRVVFANVNLVSSSGSEGGLTKSRIVCIENYGLSDESGFNPYDYVLKTRFSYQENDLPIVVEYRIKNGDPAERQEVSRRQIEEAETNAFIRSGEYFYKLISPVQKFASDKERYRNLGENDKTKELEEKIKVVSKNIVDRYASKIIVEFNLKNLKALYLNSQVDASTRTSGSASALAGSIGIFELPISNEKKLILNVLYIPANIISKMKNEPETKRYNIIIRIERSLSSSLLVRPIVNFPDFPTFLDREMIVVVYLRGLEHYQSVTPSDSTQQGSDQSSSSSAQSGGSSSQRSPSSSN